MTKTFWNRFNETVPARRAPAKSIQNDVAELLSQVKVPLADLGQEGEITKEDIVAELNNRNFSVAPPVYPVTTREQAIVGGVCFRLHHRKWPLMVSEPWHLSERDFNTLVNNALYKARAYVGKPDSHGVDWWKHADSRYDWRPVRIAYYRNATYPYKSEDLVRSPGRKVW